MKKTTQLMEELNGSDDINSFLSNNKDRGHKNIPAKSNIWISDICRSKTSKQG